MVQARHDDGAPMSNAEIRDQLVTMLAAGHETTAHTLSWAVERLRATPRCSRRLVAEVDAGGSALRDATIREVQRVRPVIAFAGRARDGALRARRLHAAASACCIGLAPA